MRFHIISDTHNEHDRLKLPPSVDVLVHCGDVGTKGNYTEARAFLEWYVKQHAKYKILVYGNHDAKGKTHPELIYLAHEYGIIVLNNDTIDIEGIKIHGVSETFKAHDDPRFVEWEGNSLTDRITAWKDIPKDLDLLITHMPPYGILDTNETGIHIGCKMLLAKIKEVKPKIHTFGHVHEHAGGTATAFGTKFYNMACKNQQYFLISNGYELDINPK